MLVQHEQNVDNSQWGRGALPHSKLLLLRVSVTTYFKLKGQCIHITDPPPPSSLPLHPVPPPPNTTFPVNEVITEFTLENPYGYNYKYKPSIHNNKTCVKHNHHYLSCRSNLGRELTFDQQMLVEIKLFSLDVKLLFCAKVKLFCPEVKVFCPLFWWVFLHQQTCLPTRMKQCCKPKVPKNHASVNGKKKKRDIISKKDVSFFDCLHCSWQKYLSVSRQLSLHLHCWCYTVGTDMRQVERFILKKFQSS